MKTDLLCIKFIHILYTYNLYNESSACESVVVITVIKHIDDCTHVSSQSWNRQILTFGPPAVLTTVLTETSAPSTWPPNLDQQLRRQRQQQQQSQKAKDFAALPADASATKFSIYHVRDK